MKTEQALADYPYVSLRCPVEEAIHVIDGNLPRTSKRLSMQTIVLHVVPNLALKISKLKIVEEEADESRYWMK